MAVTRENKRAIILAEIFSNIQLGQEMPRLEERLQQILGQSTHELVQKNFPFHPKNKHSRELAKALEFFYSGYLRPGNLFCDSGVYLTTPKLYEFADITRGWLSDDERTYLRRVANQLTK